MSVVDNKQIQTSKQELRKISISKLKKKCKSLKLSAQGNKGELVERIINKMYINASINDENNLSTSQHVRPQSIVDGTTKRVDEFAEELQKWVEYVLEMKFTHSFFVELKYGVVLCELLNKIKAGTCCKYEHSERTYVQKRNIKIYLSGCRALKIPKAFIYAPDDLARDWKYKSNQRKILSNLHYVIKLAKKAQIDAEHIEITEEYELISALRQTDLSMSDSSSSSIPALDTNYSDSLSLRKRKFKMLDPAIQKPKSTVNPRHFSLLDNISKKLLVIGYIRKFISSKFKSVQKMVSSYCIGFGESFCWQLTKYDINDILEEEENELMYHCFKMFNVHSIVLKVWLCRSGNNLSFVVHNENKTDLRAYIYCKCTNNDRMCKKLFVGKKRDKMQMDVMNIKHYEEKNLNAFESAFLSLNADYRNSAKYFQMPSIVNDENLEFVFFVDLLSPYHRINTAESIKFKWNGIKVVDDSLFDGFEIYSNNFGANGIEFDDCWCLAAKYSSFYHSFGILLKLIKLPSNIDGVKVECNLCVNGEQNDDYGHQTKKIRIGGGNDDSVVWDEPSLNADDLKTADIEIEVRVIEVYAGKD